MNNNEFIDKVNKPYKQAWTIILLAQKAIYSGKDEDWDRYAKEADRFCKEGIHNPFQTECGAFVYKAVDGLLKMNRGNDNESESTGKK